MLHVLDRFPAQVIRHLPDGQNNAHVRHRVHYSAPQAGLPATRALSKGLVPGLEYAWSHQRAFREHPVARHACRFLALTAGPGLLFMSAPEPSRAGAVIAS
jgi:hypothetical protein